MLTARTRKRWRLPAPPEDLSAGESAAGAEFPGFPPLLARLLRQRGHADPEAARRFLQPKLTDLDDPAALPGCAAAAARLARAVAEQQPVVIYGDYDVDGVTASAILWHTLTALGHRAVTTYVPHRLDEGYGLNAEAFTQFADAGSHPEKPLVISVDCGITAVDVAAHAKSLGLELIITDHHQFDPENLPDAAALVHPELEDADDPTPLCGAGVAFKVAWQTARTHHNTDSLPDAVKRLMLDLLAFAALGTVADVVPLVGENRVITVHGLSRIKHTGFVGLNALIDAAELRAEKVDAYHVGFVLGPRLNACGRMGHAKEAVELLTRADAVRAAQLADFLTKEHDRRRATERRIVEQAKAMVVERGDDTDDRRAIVLAHEDWHPGVIGIVASRLVETFHRPTILLGIDRDKNQAKGSGRSIDGVDLHAAMQSCADHCTRFGGHAMAAGLTLPPDHIDAYREQLVTAVNGLMPVDELTPEVRIDAEVELCDCQLPLFNQLERLAPFGRSNPKPRLLVRGAILARPGQRMGGGGKHLSLSLRDDHGTGVRAVGFGFGDLAEELPAGVAVDVVFQPKTNTWRGVTSPELHLVDVRVVVSA
ncbi:MAG: single-stranded-DNA-specific exonuclease RecJ [Planctomycetota bacterium]